MKFPLWALGPFLLGALLPPARAMAGDQARALCEDIKKPFFTVSCDAAGRCVAAAARQPSSARSFAVPKPSRVKRVFVLGESVAELLGAGEELRADDPGLEVINCGMGGYDSWRIAEVFEEVLKYEPDLVVVLSGNNEGGYPCPGLSFELRRRAARLEERFYALKYGSRAAGPLASLKMHERRLAAMAKEAGARKLPLVLCTLPANLRDMPPSGSPPFGNAAFAAGMEAFETGNYARAGELFGQVLKEDPYELFSRFYLAGALYARGRFAEAGEAYRRTLELDPAPARTTPSRNAMIRRVAEAGGAGLCDLERVFSGLSANGLPGAEQFADAMHWHRKYNKVVWYEIAKSAAALGLAVLPGEPPRVPGGALTQSEARQVFSYCVADIYNAFYWPGFLSPGGGRKGSLSEKALAGIRSVAASDPGLLERAALSGEAFSSLFIKNFWTSEMEPYLGRLRPLFLGHLAEAARRRGDVKMSLSLAERAVAEEPERTFFRIVRARALLRLGEKSAAARDLSAAYASPEFRRQARALGELHALAFAGRRVSPAEAGLSEKTSGDGVDRLVAGDRDTAEKLLLRAAALNPANAEALLSLCGVQAAKKEFLAALDSCDLAVWGADSYYPSARLRLTGDARRARAGVLAALGRREAAIEDLRGALKDAPPDWAGRAAAAAELAGLGGQ